MYLNLAKLSQLGAPRLSEKEILRKLQYTRQHSTATVVRFPQDETMRLLHTIRADSSSGSRQQKNSNSRQAPRGSGKLRPNGSEYD